MAKLKTTHGCPYGGIYDLNLPEKGMKGRGSNFKQLLENISIYRKANAIPIGLEYSQEVEREVCLKYPNECEDTDPRIPKLHFRLGIGDVMRGTQMSIKHRLSGSPLMDQLTANARAKICSTCPWNVSATMPCGSAICSELKSLVQTVVGSKITPYDDSLRTCAVCHCWTGIAVWIDLKIQQSVLTEAQKESFRYAANEIGCWKGEGL